MLGVYMSYIHNVIIDIYRKYDEFNIEYTLTVVNVNFCNLNGVSMTKISFPSFAYIPCCTLN